MFGSLEGLAPAAPCPTALRSDELLTAITAAQQTINQATARQLACVAEFAHRQPAPEDPAVGGAERTNPDGVSEFAATEIGCALRISRRAADRLLDTALALHRLPATSAALAAGDLDLPRVRLVCAETAHLDDAHAAAVETRVLPRAPQLVYSQLRRALRRAALTLAPAAETQRQTDIAAQRTTWVDHDGDGRSRYTAEGPTHHILRIAAAVDAVARTPAPAGPGTTQPGTTQPGTSPQPPGRATLAQRRFDALATIADTILDDPTLPRTRYGPPGIVLLADVATLARLHGEEPTTPDQPDEHRPDEHRPGEHRPVEVAGDGPIPDRLATELLAAAHTTVIPYDPSYRWTCEHTPDYRVSDRLARHLAGLHPRCAFPGCATPAHRCDWDHLIPWPDGPTCACNLIPLCRYHHRLKTHTRWRAVLHPDRHITWTSPTGRHYTIHPDEDNDAHPTS